MEDDSSFTPRPILKFPPIQKIERINNTKFDRDRKMLYIRSCTKAIIDFVCDLKCSHCEKLLYPGVGPYHSECGHLLCGGCVKRVIKVAHIELGSILTYDCKRCFKEDQNEVNALQRNGVFRQSRLMQEFMTQLYDLDVPAYKCVDCQKFHPRNNTIVCLSCSDKFSEIAYYSCVWCARRKHDKPEDCSVRSIQDSDKADYRLPTDRMGSIGAPFNLLGAGLVQCAICAFDLDDWKMNMKDVADGQKGAFLLGCGHLAHLLCDTNLVAKKIYPCNFCQTEGDVTLNKVDKLIIYKDRPVLMGQLFECGWCDETHPRENGVRFGNDFYCNWCYLEKQHDQNAVRRSIL